MDSASNPVQGVLLPYTKAPYLCTSSYDGFEDWLAYPETRGHVTLEHIRYREFRKYDPAHLASVLQNWLFFGLLWAILPAELEVKDTIFIQDHESEDKTTTLSALPALLHQWHTLESGLPEDKRRARFEANAAIFREAGPLVYFLSTFPEGGGKSASINLFPALPRRVALACAELGEYLMAASRAILDPSGKFDPLKLSWDSGSYFLEQMETQGWCPFITARLESTCSLLLKQYLATVGPPLVQRNHRSCSDHECMARYTGVQHASPTCCCSLKEVDFEALAALIREQKTPVIRFASDAASPRIEVQEARNSMRYVAISHVWSDGLGNTESNSMPRCQLERIQKLVNGLYGAPEGWSGSDNVVGGDGSTPAGWFWIDTLCVPSETHHRKLNALALPRMKEIYVRADKVLVLDSELVACHDNGDPERVLARIFLCSWIRRLWTFQEGYFAKELVFLVGASFVSIAELLDAAADRDLPPPMGRIASSKWDSVKSYYGELFVRSCNGRDLASNSSWLGTDPGIIATALRAVCYFMLSITWPIVNMALGYLLHLCGIHDFDAQPWATEAKEGAVVNVLREVAYRTSTKATDEAGCLGLLLNVDTRPIYKVVVDDKADEVAMRVSADMRMVELFKLLDARGASLKPRGCIPPGILLLPGPRINIDGYRWAPQSFLLGPEQPRSIKSHDFRVPAEDPSKKNMLRPSGTLTKDGLKIQFPGLRLGKVRADGPMAQHFLIDTFQGGAKGAARGPLPYWQVLYARDNADPAWKDVAPTSESEALALIIFSYGRSWRDTQEGILVRIRHELKDGALAVSRVGRMLVTGTPEYDDWDWVKEPWGRISGDWLPVHQTWHVD